MPRILLIQPPIEDFFLTKKRTIPFGLASIAGHLRHQGHTVDILDALATPKTKIIQWPKEFDYLTPYFGRSDVTSFSLFHDFRHFGYSFEHIGAQAKDKNPFLVGISSLFTPYSGSALATAAIVKKFLPGCRVVMGGHHPTQMPEQVMSCDAVDFVIRGEGEESMGILADALLTHTDLVRVPGLVFRKPDGSLHISDPVWIENLNHRPLPAWDLVNHRFYRRSKKGAVMAVTSRGCPMACSYCAVAASRHSAPYRRRTVDDVIRELDAVIDPLNVGFIDFEDENLCLDRSWFMTLTDRIRQAWPDRIIEFRAMNGLYPPSITMDTIIAMKSAGFKTLNLSLGTRSARQLARFNRHNIVPAFETALSLARKNGLDCVSYIIAAAPEQAPHDSVIDLVYLAARPTLAGLSIFYPAPGSRDYHTCSDRGLLPGSFEMMRSSAFPVSHLTDRDQSVTLLRLARILNFMKSLNTGRVVPPAPEKCTKTRIVPYSDRTVMSRQVLKWFLHDGIIRGVETNGRIYAHQCDAGLIKQFLTGIRDSGIMGAG